MKKREPVAWDASVGAVENARAQLPQLAREFFASGRRAAAKKAKLKALHRFRLEVKRFRYTLELFAPLYGPALDQRLANLRQLQQRLGALNDCATTRRVIFAAGGKKGSLTKQLLGRLDKQEKSRKAKFVRYWKDSFDAPAEEDRWVRYLKSFAGRRRPPVAS